MKVMMVGLSSAGKTSYMGAMYKRFCDDGIGGFSIKALNSNDDRALRHIGSNLLQGIYPKGTDIRSLYRFKLCYCGDEILEFDWTDYRGGVLENFDDTDNEIEEWEEELAVADSVIVFLDSTQLTESSSGGNYNGFTQMEALSDLIQKVATTHSNENFPISLVLTKTDLMNSSLGGDEWTRVLEIIETISNSENIAGMLTGTVVGEENYNVEFPFLMSMVFGLINKKNALAKICNEKMETYNYRMNNASIWDDIGSFFTGESSWRDMAQTSLNECIQQYKKFEKLEMPINELAEFLEQIGKDDDYFVKFF